MDTNLPIYVGKEATSPLLEYCDRYSLTQLMLVADRNTYLAAGQALETALKEHGFDVKTVILSGQEITADEHYLIQALLHADQTARTYVAVGSGTITDITRFVSHRTRTGFISFPTAPSVDGFTSIGAPLVLGGLKQTVICQPPLAVFADLDILSSAPRAMIASGLGDMLGKFTSVADWKLGALVWDEPYDAAVAQRTWQAVESCAGQVEQFSLDSPQGIRSLMEGLIESGLCMLAFGSSRPASGAEHHMSHYWEMKLLQEKRPAILHGAKVGTATIMMAEQYEKIAALSRKQVIEKLKAASLPNRNQEIEAIRSIYPSPVAEEVIETQAPFLNMSPQAFDRLKEKIVDLWPEIREIAASVPTGQRLRRLLQQVDGPTEPQMTGLTDEEVELAFHYGHYLRDRFSIKKLTRFLGMS